MAAAAHAQAEVQRKLSHILVPVSESHKLDQIQQQIEGEHLLRRPQCLAMVPSPQMQPVQKGQTLPAWRRSTPCVPHESREAPWAGLPQP